MAYLFSEAFFSFPIVQVPVNSAPGSMDIFFVVTSPLNDATVSGIISISADATDNGVIEKVVFYIDNEILCEDNTAPYSCSWNTENYSNDYYIISAIAYDNYDNS